MTKSALLFSVIMFWAVLGCKNEPKSADDVAYDNFYDSVMIIHDRTMPLMGQLESLRSRLQDERRVVINSDANRFRKVNRLLSELNKAEDAMFTWMNGFNPDTIANMEEKINYIKSELSDVKHMEGLMLGGIGMAEQYLDEFAPEQSQ